MKKVKLSKEEAILEFQKDATQDDEMFLDKTLKIGYPAIRIHTVVIPVKDLAKSIAFFDKLDFSMRTAKTDEKSVSVYMQLAKK